VALGAIIVINVVYFQQGILGWAAEKWPEKFGVTVERGDASDDGGDDADEQAQPREAAS
jgi:branched-chain amino acid transport system permease protein